MKQNTAIHRMKATTINDRVFTCGCRQKVDSDVIFNPNGRPYCALHRQPIAGYMITCTICGCEEFRDTRAAKTLYCRDCADRKYKRGKYRTPIKLARREISDVDKEYIKAHPWESSREISRATGLHRSTVVKYKNKYKIPRIESPVDRFWRDHRLDSWGATV